MLSTYRFWGLVPWFLVNGIVVQHLYVLFRLMYGLRASETAMSVLGILALPIAFFVAWAAIRTSPVRIALITSGVMVLAATGVAMNWPGGEASALVMILVLHLGSTISLLVFPAIIARALGGYEAFFVAFGVSYILQSVVRVALGPAIPGIVAQVALYGAFLWVGLLLAGAIFLIPVKRALFTVEPPPRGRSLEPKHREPLFAGLLTLVPGYVLYWLYRAHGEAAHLRRSRALLSPRGAVGIAFVPLMIPIMLTTLADHLNQRAAELGLPRMRRPWAVLLWGIFLAPVAVGLVQAGLNRLASSTAKAAAAS
jgi:hypothetical protein